jgi:hypothetical protein
MSKASKRADLTLLMADFINDAQYGHHWRRDYHPPA